MEIHETYPAVNEIGHCENKSVGTIKRNLIGESIASSHSVRIISNIIANKII